MSWNRYPTNRSSNYRGGGGGSSYRVSRSGDSYRGRGSYVPSRGRVESSSSRYGSVAHSSNSGMSSSGIRSSGSNARYLTADESELFDSSRRSTYFKHDYVSSSRDYLGSQRRSDSDGSRKRSRAHSFEHSQQGSSSRRSHEDEYRSSGSRYASNNYSDSRSNYGTERRLVYKKPRPDYRPKEEFVRHRELPPPPPSPSSTKHRPYTRGRALRGRGYGYGARRSDNFVGRKAFYPERLMVRRPMSDLLAMRRAKLMNLRSMILQTPNKASVWKNRAKAAAAAAAAEETEKDEAVKAGDDAEKSGDEAKEDVADETLGDASKEKQAVTPKKDEKRTDFLGKPFLKLECPHCPVKCVTFQEYKTHLYLPGHIRAMKDKSIQLKATLGKMRLSQRKQQKKAEEDDVTNMDSRTIFCPVCKLNYSQEKKTHQMSDAHKKMRAFLMPFCKYCRISFKTPMAYEGHICSLDHIRRKNRMEKNVEKQERNKSSGYLDNFMILDSVGSGDDAEDVEKKEESAATVGNKKEKVKIPEDDIGMEYIRRVSAFLCSICKAFLPLTTKSKAGIMEHCRGDAHLKFLAKKRKIDVLEAVDEDDDASSIQPKVSKTSTDEAPAKAEGEEMSEVVDEEEEKLWADVGDLLRQVPTKSDDEDEEEGGRFDRFKSNEKKENGEVPTTDTEVKIVNGEAEPAKEEEEVEEEVKEVKA